jgi:hypothetical protein
MKTFEDMVDAYVRLRDKKKALDDAHKEMLKPYVEAMEQLEGVMLAKLNETGQENAKTKAGTVYKSTEVNVSIADKDAFRRHVIGGELWDLLDWKANKTAVKDIVEEAQEPPPGVNYSSRIVVGVRRANGA